MHMPQHCYRNYSQFWIGLLGNTSAQCTCLDVSEEECESCRDQYYWYDGTAVTYSNWEAENPNFKDCAYKSPLGWVDANCTQEMLFICERPYNEIGLYLCFSALKMIFL